MQSAQLKTLEAARRIQGFLDSQGAVRRTAVTPSLRAQLDAAVNELAACQLEQRRAQDMARTETAIRAAYRRDVYDRFLSPIGGIAKHSLGSVSELRALVMPAAPGRCDNFVTRATILADAVEPYKEVFMTYGMPAGFVDQLRTAIGQIATSTAASAHNKQRQVAATAGLKAADKSVRSIMGVMKFVLRRR
jgi:hypothetical protein